jgi:hypothetical protein
LAEWLVGWLAECLVGLLDEVVLRLTVGWRWALVVQRTALYGKFCDRFGARVFYARQTSLEFSPIL